MVRSTLMHLWGQENGCGLSVALAFPEQLRQSSDVDGDPTRLVMRGPPTPARLRQLGPPIFDYPRKAFSVRDAHASP
jgi:hypothetical protein